MYDIIKCMMNDFNLKNLRVRQLATATLHRAAEEYLVVSLFVYILTKMRECF